MNRIPVGKSRYNGLEFSVNKRFSRGYTIAASYTLARGLDNSSGDSFGGQDPLHVENEWGLADSNITHKLVASFLWQLPAPKIPRRSSCSEAGN